MKLKDIKGIQPYRFYTHEQANEILAGIKKHDGELLGITQVIESTPVIGDVTTVAYDLWVIYKTKNETNTDKT